jgi:hypothetical protein
MKFVLPILLFVALFMTACSDTRTPPPVADVQIGEVYIKASEINPADRSAPLWMAVRNTGTAPAVLIKAESAFAQKTELRDGNNQPIASVVIPAGATVDFKPSGNHALFIGLKEGLKAGEQFGAGLVLADSTQYALTVNIRE